MTAEREIKFRAWDKSDSFLAKVKSIFNYKNSQYCTYSCAMEITELGVCESVVGDDCILMQFTGLKDKNGKEIYEGDIVGMPYESDDEQRFTGKPRAVVEWNKGSFTVKCFNGNRFDLFAEEGRLKIFGNIYENPNLLEG